MPSFRAIFFIVTAALAAISSAAPGANDGLDNLWSRRKGFGIRRGNAAALPAEPSGSSSASASSSVAAQPSGSSSASASSSAASASQSSSASSSSGETPTASPAPST